MEKPHYNRLKIKTKRLLLYCMKMETISVNMLNQFCNSVLWKKLACNLLKWINGVVIQVFLLSSYRMDFHLKFQQFQQQQQQKCQEVCKSFQPLKQHVINIFTIWIVDVETLLWRVNFGFKNKAAFGLKLINRFSSII